MLIKQVHQMTPLFQQSSAQILNGLFIVEIFLLQLGHQLFNFFETVVSGKDVRRYGFVLFETGLNIVQIGTVPGVRQDLDHFV